MSMIELMNETNETATGAIPAEQEQTVVSFGQTEQTEQEAKLYSLRALCAKDILPMVMIIRKIGLKDIGKAFDPEEIKAIMGSISDEDKTVDDIAETVGISVVLKIIDVVLENLSTAEQEIFGFMAGLSGMTAVDISNLPMDVFFEMLVDIFKKKEFVGFMKVVSKLLKSEN